MIAWITCGYFHKPLDEKEMCRQDGKKYNQPEKTDRETNILFRRRLDALKPWN